MSILQTNAWGCKDPHNSILPAVTDNNGSVKDGLPVVWGRPIKGEESTSPVHVYEASRRLVEAGLSVIPIEAYEGSKSPDNLRLPHHHDRVNGRLRPSWSVFKIRRPNSDELRRWHEMESPYGLAVLGGAVSGGQYGLGLEVIDFDMAELAEPWIASVENQAPGLVSRLIRVQTPRPGLHVYYRCSKFGVCQKLALSVEKGEFGETALDPLGHPVRKTLIEVKAEGGYCLIPPSPPRCHPSCRLYQYLEGSSDLSAVPTITPEQRSILLEAARSLNEWQEAGPAKPQPKYLGKRENRSRPGDDFNVKGEWNEILTPHGWTLAGEYGEERRWCRPGKNGGVSATTNHQGSGMLHVFSSNGAPFETDKWYTKFSAFTLLNHGGNFEEAARQLQKQGYGKKTLKAGKR